MPPLRFSPLIHLRAAWESLTPALAAILVLQVFSGILIAPLLSLFPVYIERVLDLPPTFSANIRIASSIAGGVMALAGGAACDAMGRKPAYLLAMTGVVASGLIFLVRSPLPMYPLALYAGLMFGLGTVAGLAYVMETSPKGSLALATGAYFLMGTLGNALGSALSGWIARDWAAGYAVLGTAMAGAHTLLIVIAWRVLPPLPRPDSPRTLAALAGGYGEFLRRPAIWALLALRFLPTVYWGCATFLMPLLLFRLTGSEQTAGFYAGASLVVSAACQLAAGRLVDRYGVRMPMLLAVALVTLATLGQGLFTVHPEALMGFGLLGAGAAWSLSITMTTLVHGLTDEGGRAKLLGLTHVAWSGGFLAGTVLSGYLARSSGVGQSPLAFLVAAGCCATAFLCALAVARELRQGPAPKGSG